VGAEGLPVHTVLGTVGRFFGPARLAQIASGLILYLGAWFGSLKIGNDRPNIVLFSILLPAASGVTTALWYRVAQRKKDLPRPEFGLIFGLWFFIPVVFILTPRSVFGKAPATLREALVFLLASYGLFPASATLISTYSGLLGALILSVVVICITGRRMRRRRTDGVTTVPGPPTGLDSARVK